MSIKVEVEFAGLFLYVTSTTNGRVCVLAPDCRYNKVSKKHDDDRDGAHHVGYVRLDAASLRVPGVPHGINDPFFEVVHRLKPGEVSLTGLATPKNVAVMGVPKVPSLDATDVALRTGVLNGAPVGLLSRMFLEGGEFVNKVGNKTWDFPCTLKDTFAHQVDRFEGTVTWVTQSAGPIDLTLTPFAGAATTLTLNPVPDGNDQVIRIKFANLCSDNPLEWDTLEPRAVVQDVDFKWFFRLLEDSRYHDWKKRLDARELPYPVLAAPYNQGDQDCTGARRTEAFA